MLPRKTLTCFNKVLREVLIGITQVGSGKYNGKNIIIYTNMDVTLFRAVRHVIIMMRKSGSMLKVKSRGFIKGKFYQSDRLASRLRKSSIDICEVTANLLFYSTPFSIANAGWPSSFSTEALYIALCTIRGIPV
jgi:hypothetical protein